jgi:hypothetical protein
MEKKVNVGIEERLLQARKETLQNREETTLRPLGKLWGMDVFTWSNPLPGMIANTIHAFPFQVIWMGNIRDVLHTLGEDNTLCSNLHSVIMYDSSSFGLKGDWVCDMKNYICTSSVNEALEMLKAVKEQRVVLLFTVSGDEQLENRQKFEEYVKLVQVK